MWDYTRLANIFRSEEKSLAFKVENEIALAEVLTKINFNMNRLIFIEVVMSQGDQPGLLTWEKIRQAEFLKRKSVTINNNKLS